MSGLEKTNLTVDPILCSADATKGQNDGKFDITAGNAVSYVQDQVTHRSDLEIVAEGSLMQPDNQALYAMPGSSITTIAGLKGRRIGVNGPARTRRSRPGRDGKLTYPLNIAPDIDRLRVQWVADEMFQFQMLTQPFQVSSMLGGL